MRCVSPPSPSSSSPPHPRHHHHRLHQSFEPSMDPESHCPPVQSLAIPHLISAGISPPLAPAFLDKLRAIVSECAGHAPSVWVRASKELLAPSHPHSLHKLLYHSIYKDWDAREMGPPLAWIPTKEIASETNLGKLMEAKGKELLGSSYSNPIDSFNAFHRFSVDHPEIYWPLVLSEMSLHFYVPYECIFRAPDQIRPGGTWLPGAVLNGAECCLLSNPKQGKTDEINALVWRNEGQESLHSMSYGELRANVNRVANALDALGFQKGDVFALIIPMHAKSVVIYLAIILAGYVIASIADSFAPSELATRLRVSKAKAIFTQDFIFTGGKTIPLYSRIVEAQSPMAIVLPANESSLLVTLRSGDISWNKFLALAGDESRSFKYEAVQQPIESYTNIQFSSGTSGEPKAIPYSQLEPLRLASEVWAHMDVKVGDVLVWQTSLGWMVGTMVIFGTFLYGATLGLFNGSHFQRGFGEFVQDARARILGTVPTIVRAWRKSSCMDGLDWSSVRVICSTGEASNADDALWLSARASYKPILETCGGTELASAFLHGSLLRPQAFAHFSTPSMTSSFVILNDQGQPYADDQPCIGEIALKPSLGQSHTLLNADHNKIYYSGMPVHDGVTLRRHGDVFERTIGGFYKSHGRCDDAMNLQGIKTSAVEIERICNQASDHVIETAAVGVPPAGGGPDQLVIFAVLQKDVEDPAKLNLARVFTEALGSVANPNYMVSAVIIVSELPRTATNKVLRRLLRSQVIEAQSKEAGYKQLAASWPPPLKWGTANGGAVADSVCN